MATTTKPPIDTNWISSEAPVCAASSMFPAMSSNFLPTEMSWVRSVFEIACAGREPHRSPMMNEKAIIALKRAVSASFRIVAFISTSGWLKREKSRERGEHGDHVEPQCVVDYIREPFEVPAQDAAKSPASSRAQVGLLVVVVTIDRHESLNHGDKANHLHD